MRLLVAKVLQLVAIFDPYRCCKMQQAKARVGVLPMKTLFLRCSRPCNNECFFDRPCCRSTRFLLQPVAGFVAAAFRPLENEGSLPAPDSPWLNSCAFTAREACSTDESPSEANSPFFLARTHSPGGGIRPTPAPYTRPAPHVPVRYNRARATKLLSE
jgi:hypothetical protein